MSNGPIASSGQSVSERFAAAGYTFTPQNKDRDGDGRISREEFKLPTLPGAAQGVLVPADMASAPSLDETFDAYDRNRDGFIDGTEAAETPRFSGGSSHDRFLPNWAQNMSTETALSSFNTVNRDNARTVASWGIDPGG